jgi:hypothetical protein
MLFLLMTTSPEVAQSRKPQPSPLMNSQCAQLTVLTTFTNCSMELTGKIESNGPEPLVFPSRLRGAAAVAFPALSPLRLAFLTNHGLSLKLQQLDLSPRRTHTHHW